MTHTEEQSYLTEGKYKELTEELRYLKNSRRKEIADKLEYARSLGDLSENAEYHEARSQQAETESRIRDLEHVLKTATIVTRTSGSTVEVGSIVTVQKQGDSNKKEYTIVGSHEADMSQGRISHTSPLGQALLNKKKGESTTFHAPNGTEIVYKVIDIK